MFFLKLGKFVAYVVSAFAVFRIASSLFITFGTEDMAANIATSQRYLAAANSGEAINEATYVLLAAIVLGAFCEIGLSIVRKSND